MTKEEAVQKADAANKAAWEATPPVEDPITLTRVQIRQYRWSLEAQARDQFRQDLETAVFGELSHPNRYGKKLDLLWQWSWSEGHSEGFYRVADIYEELAELVK